MGRFVMLFMAVVMWLGAILNGFQFATYFMNEDRWWIISFACFMLCLFSLFMHGQTSVYKKQNLLGK